MSIRKRNIDNQLEQGQYPGWRLAKKQDGGGLTPKGRAYLMKIELKRNMKIADESKKHRESLSWWFRFKLFISNLFSRLFSKYARS